MYGLNVYAIFTWKKDEKVRVKILFELVQTRESLESTNEEKVYNSLSNGMENLMIELHAASFAD